MQSRSVLKLRGRGRTQLLGDADTFATTSGNGQIKSNVQVQDATAQSFQQNPTLAAPSGDADGSLEFGGGVEVSGEGQVSGEGLAGGTGTIQSETQSSKVSDLFSSLGGDQSAHQVQGVGAVSGLLRGNTTADSDLKVNTESFSLGEGTAATEDGEGELAWDARGSIEGIFVEGGRGFANGTANVTGNTLAFGGSH